MLGDCTAAFTRDTGGLMNESKPPSPTADDSMTEKEKDAMADQMEEFEGPSRREDRGDNDRPSSPEDPGVGSS
jgi:hypothetical protein